MDPNANLAEQIELAKALVEDETASTEATRLAELVLALDDWLLMGGFLPERWQQSAGSTLGRLGGQKGGNARAKGLSAKRRSEIAKKAAAARWQKQ